MKKFASKRAFALLASLLLQAATAIGAVNITDQPESLTSVADAAKVTLTVVATSTNSGATFSYQWFKLNNTTSSYEFFGTASSKNSLVFASVKTTDAGTYKVVVTENGTSDFAESATAEIIVNVRPKITVHPLTLPSPVQEGLDASFTVSLDASGATPFTYTWQKKVGSGYEPVGTTISKSELTDTLSLTNVQLANAGSYRVSITNPSGIIVNSKDAVLKVNSRPVILTPHATAVTTTFGASSTLKVVVGGNAPFTYRWLKNDVVIPKSNKATLSIKGTDNPAAGVAEGPGNYKVQIVNAISPNLPPSGDPFVDSTLTESALPAVVEVIHKPKIITQPQKATIDITAAPASPSLTVVMDTFAPAGSAGTQLYQWQKDGKNIADTANRTGTTTATLAFTNISWHDRGSYRVIIKNEVGTVTSAAAVITIISPPTIISQPVGPLFGATGGSVKMAIVAGGTTPLVYAWKFRPAGETLFNDKVLSKTATLSLSKLSLAQVGEYQCTISNAPKGATPNSIESNLIYVQVDDAPKITQQTTVLPYNATPGLVPTPKIPAGQKLHLKVIASGTDRPADVPNPPAPIIPANPLTYQWLKNNLPISGQNAAELILDPAQIADTGKYSCLVQNFSGKVTSAALAITVSGPPVVVGQPPAARGIQESTIETTVTVTGSPTIKYKWQMLKTIPGGTAWQDVPKKTTAKLSLVNAQPSDAGDYKCVISNDFGTTESSTVHITVDPIPSPTLAPVLGQSAFEFYPTVARAGEKVRIFGQDLNYAKEVFFGGQKGTFVMESNNAILATVPGSAPVTYTAIEVRSVNPVPAFTTDLFRRTVDYENGYNFSNIFTRLDSTILTAAPTVPTRIDISGSNLDVTSVYYLIRLKNPSALSVTVSGIPSNGKVASLEIGLYRQATTNNVNTTFIGPDGVVRFPNTPTTLTPAGTVGPNQVGTATTLANEYVLIRISGGWIFSGSNWVFYGPFQLRISANPTTILTKHSAQPVEIVQIGGSKSADKSTEASLGAISSTASSAVRFGGEEHAVGTDPVVLWHDIDGQALNTSQVVSSFTMSLESGEANGDDQFGWQVNGADGKSLLALWINSATGQICSVEPDGTVHQSIQHITPDGGAHRFEIAVNQQAGTWIVYMDGVPVTEESIPLPAGSRFSDISTVWDLGPDGQSSGASIIFDDFRVEAEIAAP